ncbi:MAG: hypothetical protein ACRDZN_17300, partial [Acidimicrobiales bacterium]
MPDMDDTGHRREQLVALAASARRAGRRAVVSGRWLADTVVDVAPRLPVRDAETLAAHYGGLAGDELADALVRSAGRVSGGIAATTGGIIAAQELTIAGLVLVPFELAAATALVVATEVKLVAELHHVAGRALPGGPHQRAGAALVSWMSGRGVPPNHVVAAVRGDVLGRAGRQQLRAVLRGRFTRNLSTLAPMLTGAAAAGYLNRRATLDVGSRVAADLGLRAKTGRLPLAAPGLVRAVPAGGRSGLSGRR